jgi:predicted enzyme related to lactoylglutathione lyase
MVIGNLGRQIVHFEIPAADAEKMSRFYSEVFDWKFEKQSMPGMDYWMIETTGRGPEDLGGGMYPKQGGHEHPRFYVGVDDIDLHTERFRQAGGVIIVEKQEIPGYGWSVLGTDPEGNVVGLFQPAQMPQPPATGREAGGSTLRSSGGGGSTSSSSSSTTRSKTKTNTKKKKGSKSSPAKKKQATITRRRRRRK